jgi:hypothetical protein
LLHKREGRITGRATTEHERAIGAHPKAATAANPDRRITGFGGADPSLHFLGPDRTNLEPFVQKRLQSFTTLFAVAEKPGIV